MHNNTPTPTKKNRRHSLSSSTSSRWLDEFTVQVENSVDVLLDGGDWKERAEVLKQLEDLFLSSLLDKNEVIVAVKKIELLVPGLKLQLADTRSAVVKLACTAISTMGKATGHHFFPIATKLIPALLNLTYVTIGVVSQSGVDCISSLIKFSRFDYHTLFHALKKSKNEARRVCATESINSILSSWPKEELDQDFLQFLQAIKLAVFDAHSKTREQGRFGLNLIVEIWPKNIASIADIAERTVRNTFIREFPDSSLSKIFSIPSNDQLHQQSDRPSMVGLESPRRLSLSEHKKQVLRHRSLSPSSRKHVSHSPFIPEYTLADDEQKDLMMPQDYDDEDLDRIEMEQKVSNSKLRKPTKISSLSSPSLMVSAATKEIPQTPPLVPRNQPRTSNNQSTTPKYCIRNPAPNSRLDKLMKWKEENQILKPPVNNKLRHRRDSMEAPTMRAMKSQYHQQSPVDENHQDNGKEAVDNEKVSRLIAAVENNLLADEESLIQTPLRTQNAVAIPESTDSLQSVCDRISMLRLSTGTGKKKKPVQRSLVITDNDRLNFDDSEMDKETTNASTVTAIEKKKTALMPLMKKYMFYAMMTALIAYLFQFSFTNTNFASNAFLNIQKLMHPRMTTAMVEPGPSCPVVDLASHQLRISKMYQDVYLAADMILHQAKFEAKILQDEYRINEAAALNEMEELREQWDSALVEEKARVTLLQHQIGTLNEKNRQLVTSLHEMEDKLAQDQSSHTTAQSNSGQKMNASGEHESTQSFFSWSYWSYYFYSTMTSFSLAIFSFYYYDYARRRHLAQQKSSSLRTPSPQSVRDSDDHWDNVVTIPQYDRTMEQYQSKTARNLGSFEDYADSVASTHDSILTPVRRSRRLQNHQR